MNLLIWFFEKIPFTIHLLRNRTLLTRTLGSGSAAKLKVWLVKIPCCYGLLMLAILSLFIALVKITGEHLSWMLPNRFATNLHHTRTFWLHWIGYHLVVNVNCPIPQCLLLSLCVVYVYVSINTCVSKIKRHVLDVKKLNKTLSSSRGRFAGSKNITVHWCAFKSQDFFLHYWRHFHTKKPNRLNLFTVTWNNIIAKLKICSSNDL